MNRYLVAVRVGGQLVRTVVFADSASHARLIVQYQLGMDSVINTPVKITAEQQDLPMFDSMIKTIKPLTPAESRIKSLKATVDRDRQALAAERLRQKNQRVSASNSTSK
jgi:hypothetical protein